MKKIVMGIAAVALATSMFAADPAFDPQVTQFDGNAEVKWGVDLDNDGKTGFKNSVGGNLKMQLFTNGDKSTEGEGIWADLKVKVADDNAWKEENGAETIPTWSIDHAKIWIEKFYVGIMAGDLLTKEFKPTLALKSDNVRITKGGYAAYTQGIIAGYDDDNLNIGVDFRSEPVVDADGEIVNQYTNEYGIAGRVELKDGNEWVNGLGVKFDIAKAFYEDSTTHLSAIAAYKIAIDDKFYLKPQVAYASAVEKADVAGAAIIFGWGDEADSNPGLYFFDDADAFKKITPGVSVVYTKNLWNEANLGYMEFAVYTGDLIGNFKAAAYTQTSLVKDADFELNNIYAACQYDVKAADDVTVTLKAGCKWVNAADDTLNLKAGVDVAGLINNTTFSAEYVSGDLIADEAGTINVGCKIAL